MHRLMLGKSIRAQWYAIRWKNIITIKSYSAKESYSTIYGLGEKASRAGDKCDRTSGNSRGL